eukprot:s136_g8.t2
MQCVPGALEVGALTKGADCLSLPLDGADYGLHLPPGPDLSEARGILTALCQEVSQMNSCANLHGHGRDDMTEEVLVAASSLLLRNGGSGAEAAVRRFLAAQVLSSFAEVRSYLASISNFVMEVDPQLACNTLLVKALSSWEEAWELGERLLLNEGMLQALSAVAALFAGSGAPAELKRMLEDQDAELFLVLPRLVVLCSLSDERNAEVLRSLLPHHFLGAAFAGIELQRQKPSEWNQCCMVLLRCIEVLLLPESLIRRAPPKRPSGSFGTLAAAKRRRQRQSPTDADVPEADIDETSYVEVEVVDSRAVPEELQAPTTPEAPPGRDAVAAAFWQDSLEADEDDLGATPSTEASTHPGIEEVEVDDFGDAEEEEEIVEVEPEFAEDEANAFASEAADEADTEAYEQVNDEADPGAYEQANDEADPEAYEQAHDEADPEAYEQAHDEAYEQAHDEADPEAYEQAHDEAYPEAHEQVNDEACEVEADYEVAPAPALSPSVEAVEQMAAEEATDSAVNAAEEPAVYPAEDGDEEEVELEDLEMELQEATEDSEAYQAAPDAGCEEEEAAEDFEAVQEAVCEAIPQPQTPQEEPPEQADLSENMPRHRILSAPAVSNLRQRSRNMRTAVRRSVSFHKADVPDSDLLDDGTGLRAIHHLLSFRDQELWYFNPGAAVECGYCQQVCPQAFGKLCGGAGRSQFAQTDFVCHTCSMQMEQDQDQAATEEPEQEAVAPEEAVGASTGPWDNPQSGWGDWLGTSE